MKILAATDIHGDIKLMKKLSKKAKENKVDAIILCGDLTLFENNIDGLFEPFLREGLKNIYFVPGNHETEATADFWAKVYAPYVKNIHKKSIKTKDSKIGLIGLGGANIGLFSENEEKVLENILNADKELNNVEKKILVVHDAPFGTKLDFIGEHVGNKGIRIAIEKIKPDLVLCGHIHETFNLDDEINTTKIINVGREGKIIEL